MNIKLHITGPFKPFPQLWDAFEAHEGDLLVGKSFGCLDDACKALVTNSKDAARTILKSNSAKM